METYRAEARANLTSKRGIALRKRRGVDVEPTFGDIKFNQGYVRCRLCGEEKVNVELGLLIRRGGSHTILDIHAFGKKRSH